MEILALSDEVEGPSERNSLLELSCSSLTRNLQQVLEEGSLRPSEDAQGRFLSLSLLWEDDVGEIYLMVCQSHPLQNVSRIVLKLILLPDFSS